MPISHAEIATASGERLINRLCKHWSHKLEVEQNEDHAKVNFDDGTCLMQAEGGKLYIAVEALDDRSLDRLEHVVDGHLERMAANEDLDIVWQN